MKRSRKLKLYKFRSLEDDTISCIKRTVETGEFWCSPLWEQNDSMEGVYSYFKSLEAPDTKVDIFTEKNSYQICSFSGRRALKDPRIWGYYANGLKGVAIEVEVSTDYIERINYKNSLICTDINSPNIKQIITTKLKLWKYENEYRFLKKCRSGYSKIGKVTGVYFGDPYYYVENRNQIFRESNKIQNYFKIRDDLIASLSSKKYSCYFARMSKVNEKWRVTWDAITEQYQNSVKSVP